MPAAIASQAGAPGERPAIEGHHRRRQHAGDGEVGGRRQVDAGDDQHEGLPGGDDQQRHHGAQDVAPGVGGHDLGDERHHDQDVEPGQQQHEILGQQQPAQPGAAAPARAGARARDLHRAHASLRLRPSGGAANAAPPADHGLLPFLVQTM